MTRFTVTPRDFDTDADQQDADDRWSEGEDDVADDGEEG